MTSRRGGALDITPLLSAEVSHPAVTHDRVAHLAHELYLARGGGDGQDLEDWLEAERFFQQRDNPILVHD